MLCTHTARVMIPDTHAEDHNELRELCTECGVQGIWTPETEFIPDQDGT